MKTLRKEAADQAIHAAVAYAVVLVAGVVGIPRGAFVGLALGLVREVTEGGDFLSAGSVRDLLFWTLGGGVAGWVES